MGIGLVDFVEEMVGICFVSELVLLWNHLIQGNPEAELSFSWEIEWIELEVVLWVLAF